MSPLPFLLVLSAACLYQAHARREKIPLVPWAQEAVFESDSELSDEFSGSSLDLSKWDPHGIRNPDTGCPKWNGPPSERFPDFSVFFPTPTDPLTRAQIHQQYYLRNGRLELQISEKNQSYFEMREYYCDSETSKCNHDSSIDCFATDFFGRPIYADAAKTRYQGVIHDKCKKEPHCIPHPEFVTGKPRVYKRLAGPHISSQKSFKYGFVETKVRVPRSSTITAVWMHDDTLVNGYCRYRTPNNQRECPSLIRSRRWQEIDMIEAMNAPNFKRKYIPNIHSFSMYKGEFSSATSADNGDGLMGGGPITVDGSVFRLKVPGFDDIPQAQRRPNDWHMNAGSVTELDSDWASQSRTIGMYWSPTEIRFYLDGVEVKRLKNTMIHQPMRLDISTAINVAWSDVQPTSREIRRRAKIFYVRKWSVFTEDGAEPSSTLPLDTRMERTFQDLYGTEIRGVFGRFPDMDVFTQEETIPDPDDVVEGDPPPGEAPGPSVRTYTGNWTESNAGNLNRLSSDYIMDPLTPLAIRMAGRNSRLTQAGGNGNLRYSRKRRRMNRRERERALANPDRISIVSREGADPKIIEDAAITAFEFTDPNKEAAGWSTVDGLGTQPNIA